MYSQVLMYIEAAFWPSMWLHQCRAPRERVLQGSDGSRYAAEPGDLPVCAREVVPVERFTAEVGQIVNRVRSWKATFIRLPHETQVRLGYVLAPFGIGLFTVVIALIRVATPI